MTRSLPRTPSFLVIGAQKAGTTYLCAGLAQHPRVFFSNPKELMFFNRKADLGGDDFKKYLDDHFASADRERWVGEGSTTYFQSPLALPRIRTFLGQDLRIILCIRHPVEKAVSFYLHNWRMGRLAGQEPLFDPGPGLNTSPIETSLYAPHLRRWLEAYGRERLHVIDFDLLKTSRPAFLRAATDALEISPLAKTIERVVNPGPSIRREGEQLVVTTPPQDGQTSPRFALDDLAKLQAVFDEDIRQTEDLLDMDLTHWKTPPTYLP